MKEEGNLAGRNALRSYENTCTLRHSPYHVSLYQLDFVGGVGLVPEECS